MKIIHIYYSLVLFISFNQFIFSNVDSSFAKKEIMEIEDQCLNRPYYKRAEPFYFIPALRAKLKQVGDKFSFTSRCFGTNYVFFKELSRDKMTFTLQNFNKTETFCSEIFFFHTSDHNYFQFVAFQGEHEIVIKRITQDDRDEIAVNGVKLYNFCGSIMTTLKSIYKTFKAFYGGLGLDPDAKNPRYRSTVPREMERINLRILDLFNHYTLERRNNTIVNINKTNIKSGDALVIARMDGIDPMIMLGSGGHIGHCCVCTWMNGSLYVVEAQDAPYWPRKGVQRNLWEDWVQWAHNADFNVALLPLKEEYRQKLNVTQANAWFENEVEGLNYGFHNFLFSWFDTPDRNLPKMSSNELLELLASLLSKVYPKLSDLLVTEAVNLRLGTKNLTLQQAIAESARRGKSFEDLVTEPEIEGYEYSDGLNYVCSCFVIAFYEHGGLFGDLEILPNEFTPRDVYTLGIFDTNYERPQECIDDNPELPYCQITGKFVLKLDNYSTIEPYSHMNERCPTVGPDFIRDEGC